MKLPKRAESVRIHNIELKQKIISEEDAWISTTGTHQRITFGETCFSLKRVSYLCATIDPLFSEDTVTVTVTVTVNFSFF